VSLSDALRAAANAGRTAAAAVDQRPTTVTIATVTYDASLNIAGAEATLTSALTLSPNPKVEPFAEGDPSWYGGNNGANAGALLRAGVYKVGPITPTFPGGGYSVADLAPDAAANKQVVVSLAGGAFPAAGETYRIVGLDDAKPQSIFLFVARTKQ
jgi:hypothetical protein